jgi:hypothetical protein
MQKEKWLDIKDSLRDKFNIVEENKEIIEGIPNASREIIIFASPMGKIKLVFEFKPRILDRKTLFSNRAGASMSVQYEYSDNEFVGDLRIFKWDDCEQDWVKAQLEI